MRSSLSIVLLCICLLSQSQITWHTYNNGAPQAYNPKDIVAAPNGDIYIMSQRNMSFGEFPKLIKSTNNGLLWTEVIMSGLPNMVATSMIFAGNKLLLSGKHTTLATAVYESTDNGLNWALNTGMPSNYSCWFLTENDIGTIYLAGRKALPGPSFQPFVMASLDNGVNWNEIAMSGIGSMDSVTAFGFLNGQLYIATTQTNTNTNEIYRSADGGQHWTLKGSGIPADIIAADFASDGPVMYILGKDLFSHPKLYSTLGDFGTWTEKTMNSPVLFEPNAIFAFPGTGVLLSSGIALTINPAYVIYISDLTVGIKEQDFATIKVFPVPSETYLSIHIVNTADLKSVTVLSISGQVLRTYFDNFQSMDISPLAPGVYELSIQTSSSVFVKKLVKSN